MSMKELDDKINFDGMRAMVEAEVDATGERIRPSNHSLTPTQAVLLISFAGAMAHDFGSKAITDYDDIDKLVGVMTDALSSDNPIKGAQDFVSALTRAYFECLLTQLVGEEYIVPFK